MELKLPTKLDKYAHDDIVGTLIELNPRFFRPTRSSWLQGTPDMEDPHREVVEVALTNLRDAWGQCLYYYRSGATQVHLILSPKHFLDYKNKEAAFIKANPIPNVKVYALPELPIKSYLLPQNRKKPDHTIVRVPQIGFIITDEDRERERKKNIPKPNNPETHSQPVDIDYIPSMLPDTEDKNTEDELPEKKPTYQPTLEETHFKESAEKIFISLKKFKGKPVVWQKVARSAGLDAASKDFKKAIDYLWMYERIEIQRNEKEGDRVETREEKITELKMVEVLTPCGQKALISGEAYEKEKNGENFWGVSA